MLILSALYFLGRLTGLIQAQLLVSLLPPEAADAYFAAFTLPDYLNYLVASGTLSLTFIPIFTRHWTNNDEAGAWRFFSTLATVMGTILIVATALLMLAARPLVELTTPGFTAPDKAHSLELAVAMTRIVLPAQLFFYLGGLMIGALNSFKRFGATGWTGAVYNMVAMLLAVPLWITTHNPLVFAWGILVGAFGGNFLLPWLSMARGPEDERPVFRFRFDFAFPPVKRYFLLSLPIMLSVSIATADVWVTKYFASQLPTGGITHFNAAYRLMIAAQGIIGQAAAVASFPFLAAKVAENDLKAFAQFLRSSLRRLFFITLAVSLFLVLGAAPLCRLIYGYGKMADVTAQVQTAQAFAFLCVGLFAWASQGLVARGFYALGDTKTPNIVGSFITIVIFIPLCWFAKNQAGVAGLALATTIAIGIYLVWLIVALDKKLAQSDRRVRLGLDKIGGALMRHLMACALAGAAGVLALRLALPVIAHDKVGDIGLLLWSWGIAGYVFITAAKWFQISEWFWLRDKIKRRRKAA